MERSPQMKSTPVDPNNPEKPIDLLPKAINYLVEEFGRLTALSTDCVACTTPFAAGVLIDELNKRLTAYSQRGLRALVQITNNLVKETANEPGTIGSNNPVAQPRVSD